MQISVPSSKIWKVSICCVGFYFHKENIFVSPYFAISLYWIFLYFLPDILICRPILSCYILSSFLKNRSCVFGIYVSRCTGIFFCGWILWMCLLYFWAIVEALFCRNVVYYFEYFYDDGISYKCCWFYSCTTIVKNLCLFLKRVCLDAKIAW